MGGWYTGRDLATGAAGTGLAGDDSNLVPQFSQYAAPLRLLCWQAGQTLPAEEDPIPELTGASIGAAGMAVRKSTPQSSQKMAPATTAAPQFGQFVTAILPPPCLIFRSLYYARYD
jgi:hypothetical protein